MAISKDPVSVLIERFVERLKGHWGDNLISVVLYGSAARGDARPDSDIDLLIVCEDLPVERLKRRAMITPIEMELDEEIACLKTEGYTPYLSTLLKTRVEAAYHSPLYLDMVEDARILFDRGGFFAGVLEEMRQRMAELGSRRVFVGRQWYWVLKPSARFGEAIEV